MSYNISERERVGEESTPPEHEFVHTLETDSEIEFEWFPQPQICLLS